MRLDATGELSLLKRIRNRFNARAKDIVAGIGDDSAVVVPGKGSLLLTTDMMIEGVHFDLGYVTFFQLGFKIVSVNVSDIYAMGGKPRFVLIDLAAAGKTEERSVDSFFDGVQNALCAYGLSLIGGDLSSSPSGMVASATVLGYAEKPVMRSGARPGDRIYVTGSLGDSACGHELLKRIRRPLSIETGERTEEPLKWRVMGPLVKRHLMPEARRPGKIARVATAMIDVSDGLFIDLSRLCDESGVGARIYMKDAPISSQMKKAAYALGFDPYALATSGGEDYELLFTAPASRKVDAVCIGEVTTSGRVVVNEDGSERTFSAEGYRHWR